MRSFNTNLKTQNVNHLEISELTKRTHYKRNLNRPMSIKEI